jgi:uncharacterized integral membrane protein
MTSQPHDDDNMRTHPVSEEVPAHPPPEVPQPAPDSALVDKRAVVDKRALVIKRTRISGTWIAVIVATILLIFLLVFILQNLTAVTVSFLGFSGNLPLGVALLFASIIGALLVALVGAARILQLRRRVRRDGTL